MNLHSLLESPTEHDFYQAVFSLQKQLESSKSKYRKVGYDSIPKNELIRFKADQHLGFPGQPISSITSKENNGKEISVDMLVSFMGLTGPSGVLPQHYSELVLERLKLKDTGMKDFYDLFNHRLISLFYRAWEKYRFSVNFHGKSNDFDAFTSTINRLSGNQDKHLLYAGIFNKRIRSADGLSSILKHFTSSDITIKQFQGKWEKLAENEQTRLGGRKLPEGQFARLGVDASIGSRIWDINSSIDIYIKPPKNSLLKDCKKRDDMVTKLKSLVSSYVGVSVKYKLYLEITKADIVAVQLAKGGGRLGMGAGLIPLKKSLTTPCILPL